MNLLGRFRFHPTFVGLLRYLLSIPVSLQFGRYGAVVSVVPQWRH